MKICPLITQASILEDKDLLVREADDADLARRGKETPQRNAEIFINPAGGSAKETPAAKETAAGRSARFIAKSFRGEVECIGEICRFHDDDLGVCRFEKLIRLAAEGNSEREEAIAALSSGLDRSWEFQQKSTADLLAILKEHEERRAALAGELRQGFERSIGELRELIRTASAEKGSALEDLAAKTVAIERKIEDEEKNLKFFRDEVTDWKGILSKNLDAIETELATNKRIVENLSENHTGIVKLVEDQKKNIEEEERKRQKSEAHRLNNAGVMAYHNGQYEKALDLFQKALANDDAFTEAYNNLGLTYTEIGKEDEATQAFKKAIELSPELAASYNNLGYVFYRIGSYEEAIEMYNEAIGRSKDSSSAYTNLGNACYKLDKVEDAIEAWRKALEIDPANEKARRNLKRFHAEVK